MHRCIPEPLAIPLTLAQLERREVRMEDGHRRFMPYIWRVEVRFGNRRCFTGAMVWGQEVLLGAIPMEDMGLALRAQRQSLEVIRRAPNNPLSGAIGVGCGLCASASRECMSFGSRAH